MLIFLVNGDSTAVDTVITYEIPEIVHYYDGISMSGEITPAFYEQSNIDMLSRLPVVLFAGELGQVNAIAGKGRKVSYTGIYLNGRLLRNQFLGFVDLVQLPLHFFDKATYGRSVAGAELSSLNLESKVNHFDRPYSYAHFLFGSFQSNIYGADFTRAITNDVGLYLSGEYYKTGGYRANAAGDRLSLYSNIYYNQLLPVRCDVFYCENKHDLSGSTVIPTAGRQKDRFLDISSTVAYQNGITTLFYNSQSMQYVDTLNARWLESQITQFGIVVDYHHDLLGVKADYGLAGYYRSVDASTALSTILYTLSSYVDYPFDVWARLSKQFGRLSFGAAGYVGVVRNHENIYCPKLEVGYDFLRSTRLYATLSKDARRPAELEKEAIFDTLVPYLIVAGNQDLTPEYCWAKEVGVRGEHYSVNLYRFDFDDLIAARAGSVDYYQYANIDSWRTSGCEASVNLPLRIHNTNPSSTFTVVIAGSGNILLEGDSIPYMPRYHGRGHLSVTRETERLSFGIALIGEFSSIRYDISGAEYSGYSIFSAAGLVKFMSLSCILRVNNVFDEDYAYMPHYPMPPRNFSVSVKWEFWD